MLSYWYNSNFVICTFTRVMGTNWSFC